MRERGQKHTLNDLIHNNCFKAKVVHYITFKITLKKELTGMSCIAWGGHKMTINFLLFLEGLTAKLFNPY